MPVCITGMHRSGTSMVAKLLRESGLYLGPTVDIMPAADENPEGFWENVKVVELNEELLSRLGAGWDCPPPATSDWSEPAITALRPAALGIIDQLSEHEPWGWKDPRTCLTLPFWQELVDDLRVVLVLRNPLEVARSLRARNGFSYALGLTLWRLSYQRMLGAVPAAMRVVTHYDAYFAQPEVEYERVLGELGMRPASDVIAEFRQSNADRLRHHRFNQADLAGVGVDASIRTLYQALCQEAEWSDSGVGADIAPAEYTVGHLGAFDTIGLGIGEANRLTIENSHLRRELAELRGDYHREVAIRDAQINEMQATIADHVVAIDHAETERRDLTEHLRELRTIAYQQQERLAAAEVRVTAATIHQDDLRDMLTSAHQQLFHRDAEIMATLGIALSRHAPGAPAAIYYRLLLERVRAAVTEHLPPEAPVAVAALGDDAMLQLDGRPARHFPLQPESNGHEAHDDPSADQLLAQIDELRRQGTEYLVMPTLSWSWSSRIPHFTASLERRYEAPVRVAGVCTVYDVREPRSVATA